MNFDKESKSREKNSGFFFFFFVGGGLVTGRMNMRAAIFCIQFHENNSNGIQNTVYCR